MGTDANAQAIYTTLCHPRPWRFPACQRGGGYGITSGYQRYAYLDRFYIELNISEKDAAALTATMTSFMSDILNTH